MSETSPCSPSVEEFHGPYGPYQVSELVLQKIWLERAFDETRLRDQWGRVIEIVHPGEWNRLEGPDFKNARLRLDGEEVMGDVEVHFSESDWVAHGHAGDAAYGKVILHVLYYEPALGARPAYDGKGGELPRLSLLPLLWYSLEEYAGDDSLVALTGVDLRPEVEALMRLPLPERRIRLIELARRRWEMKCFYARKRVDRLGWEGACHQSCLEALGYARNRIPMLMVAERYPLSDFARNDVSLEAALDCGRERWRYGGCRPENYPNRRLQQYISVARKRPNWPNVLFKEGAKAMVCEVPIPQVEWGSLFARRTLEIAGARKLLSEAVLAGVVYGPKADTLSCDVFLPLLAARSGMDCYPLWFHWNAGNAPASIAEALRTLQILEPKRVPLGNGWVQGILGARDGRSGDEALEEGFQAHA